MLPIYRSVTARGCGGRIIVDAVTPSRGLQSALSTFILQHSLPPAGRAAIAPGSSFHIDDYRDSHSKDRRRILNIIGPGPSAYSHTPTEWRQTFAEAQLPYAKIMGCVQSLVHAGSLALKNQLRRYEVEIKPARKPNLSNGRDKSLNLSLIIH